MNKDINEICVMVLALLGAMIIVSINCTIQIGIVFAIGYCVLFHPIWIIYTIISIFVITGILYYATKE